jgi:hypothetical protein
MAWYTTNWRRLGAIALLTLVLAGASRACPVCSANRTDQPRRSSWAMVATTGAMMLLPITMVGGFVWWLRKNL